MNPYPDPSHHYPCQPPLNNGTTPVHQASQSCFQQRNEQILWLQQQQQQQHQRLREQQAAIMQLFYAHQARGFSTDAGTHDRNNMLSNPFATALTPFPYAFPPFLNAPSTLPSSPQLNNISYQYPLSQSFHQPPPPFPPLPSPALRLSHDDSPTEGDLIASAFDSNTPVSDWQKPDSVETPLLNSTAAEFSAVDDLILAKALYDHNTSTEAISSLEGARDRSGSAWQEYYTSKRHIIDEIVRELYLSKHFPTARATNSRQHTPTLGIPTKEPTPSRTLVPHNGGNKYTEEDNEYFTQYVLWRFSQNVKAAKATICRALYTKAPHHSFESWKTYWWSRDSDIERVRKLFKNGTPPQRLTAFKVRSSRTSHGRSTRLVSPLTQGTRSWGPGRQKDELVSEADISSPGSDSSTSDSSDSSEDDQAGQSAGIRVSTCRNPIPYTKADMQAVVEYVADHPNVLLRTMWNGLAKLRPAHTSKAWGEYYRRNQATIDRKMRRLVIQRNKKSRDTTVVLEDVEPPLKGNWA
ncbi:hypothetical protein JB92DRAFT_859369 [Gautieria morchelliformis]|nr:hypothetical protein JB92DRAFT_859369 [Gautieria morchelliformis]